MPVQPPGERVEPEDRAVQQSNTLRERIQPSNMRKFVGEDGAEFIIVPSAPIGRKQNRRSPRSYGYRDGNPLRFPKPRADREGAECPVDGCRVLRDRTSVAHKLARHCNPHPKPNQKEDRAQQIGSGDNFFPAQ